MPVAVRAAQNPVEGERSACPILVAFAHSAPWLLSPCCMSLFSHTLCTLLAVDENEVTLVALLRSHMCRDNIQNGPIRAGV